MNKKNRKKVMHNLRIGQIFGVLSSVLSILSWFGISLSVIITIIRRSWSWVWGLLCIVSILVLLLLFVLRRYNSRIISWSTNLFAPNLPYQLLSWEIDYKYISLDEMYFYATYTVKAMQTGVDHIHVRYNWSGESDNNPISPQPVTKAGFETDKLEFDGKEYGYSNYKLYSKDKFNKNDSPFKLGVSIGPLKVGTSMISHHLLTSISMATDSLTMKVHFPSNLEPRNIRCSEYLHSTDFFHWHSYEKEPIRKEDKKGWSINWIIPYPVYGGKYLIKWDCDDSD